MEWLGTTITAIINAGSKIYLAALIAASALLFLPASFIAQLGLDDFRHTYRTQAGAVLVISASLLFTSTVSVIWEFVSSPLRRWKFNRKIYKTLTELTVVEKAFLTPYILGDENTQLAPMHQGIATGLEAKQILYRSSNVSAGLDVFPYNMQPYARKILSEHRELLL